MSFWGATVITSLVTAIPIIGQTVVDWLWGGFTINNATLNRFFSLHFFLPFVIAGASLLHLALLHKSGSNNPLGITTQNDKIPFFPYFFVKDLFALYCYLFIFGFLIFFYPNFLGHSDNYIPANPMQTPAHIVPEWYFLPFYAILRSIPDKLGGVVAMGGSLIILFLIPFLNTSEIRNSYFRVFFKIFYWLFISDFFILGWVGQKPVKDAFVIVGQIATLYYFLFFLVIIPIVGIIETQIARIKQKIIMFIFKLFSTSSHILRVFIDFLISVFKYKIFRVFLALKKSSNLKSQKTITLLKSPHVNKNAQSHFKVSYFACSFLIHCKDHKRFIYIFNKIKRVLFFQLLVKVTFCYSKFSNTFSSFFDVNLFELKYFNCVLVRLFRITYLLLNSFGFSIFKLLIL